MLYLGIHRMETIMKIIYLKKIYKKWSDKFIDLWYDYFYNVKTVGAVHYKNNRIIDYDYEPSPYSDLKKIFSSFTFNLNSHLLDYGCGKGRVLIMAVAFGCHKVTGIDFNNTMCDKAKANIKQCRFLNCEESVSIVNQDAIQYLIDPTVNYFFFFNPFHMKVFIYVLKNIQKSVEQSPRDIQLIFYRPQKSTIWQVERMGCFNLKKTIKEPYCLIYDNYKS